MSKRTKKARRSGLIGYGLGPKLAFVFGGLITLIVVVVIFINVKIQVELVRERMALRSQQVVQLGVEVSLPYLIEGRPAELEVIFEEINSQPDVAHAFLLSEDGELLIDGAEVERVGFLTLVEDPLAQRAHQEKRELREIDGAIERIAFPIFVGNTNYGIMRLDIRRDSLQGEISTVWTRNAFFGALFILVGLTTSVLLARRLTEPLKHLTEATERAAAGELEQVIEVHTNDEIESLATSFGTMLETMRDSIQQIHRLAYLDKLTKIPNRAWFSDQIERITVAKPINTRRFAVMFLDVDNFKSINDRHGHHVGDVLLSTFAERLRDCIAGTGLSVATIDQALSHKVEGAMVARLGGDEFTLILPAEAAEEVAQQIIEAVAKPMTIDSRVLSVSTSIGLAVFPDHATSSRELLKVADAAMYQAKQAGRNCFRVYDQNLHRAQLDSEELQGDLLKAIEEQQFEIFLQPQFEVATGQLCGAEALVRWHHPTRGLMTPDTFLPVAASAGLMPRIGQETTRLAIAAARRIQWMMDQPFVVAANLSVDELMEPHFIEELIALIQRSGIDPAGLEIEITESTAMYDDTLAAEYLGALRAQGVRLAIDDFGVGFSNLGRLKSLAFDTLKVDKSLLVGVEGDDEAAFLLTTIFDLARAVQADVVAEGVETPAQLAFLRQHQCKFFQGYLGGRPVPSEDFVTGLRDQLATTAGALQGVPEHRSIEA